MKKHLIAAAVLALVGTGAFAQNSTTSMASGQVATSSVLSGPGVSTHTATSYSTNTSTASGIALPGIYAAGGTSAATTNGTTLTAAGGLGAGTAGAMGNQVGEGDSTHGAPSLPLGSGSVSVNSNAVTGTQSTASVVNTGLSGSFSNGQAENNSSVLANAIVPGTSNATGTTTGTDSVAAGGFGTWSAAGLLGGGVGSASSGYYNGTITRP